MYLILQIHTPVTRQTIDSLYKNKTVINIFKSKHVVRKRKQLQMYILMVVDFLVTIFKIYILITKITTTNSFHIYVYVIYEGW